MIERELTTGMWTRDNRDPSHLRMLMSWSGTIIYWALFFLPITWVILFRPHISSERRLLFPFFGWKYFVLVGLDQLVSQEDFVVKPALEHRHVWLQRPCSFFSYMMLSWDLYSVMKWEVVWYGERMERSGSNPTSATYMLGDLKQVISLFCPSVRV